MTDEAEPTSVLILGTAHVMPLRTAIQHHLYEFGPGVVGVELDRDRLEGLLAPPHERDHGGIGYRMLAKFQERVADDLGGQVGDEMLAAREAAMAMGVPIALIDMHAQRTLKRLVAEMGWTERLRLAGSALASLLPGRSVQDELQRAIEGDPSLMEEVTRKFPTVKRVLIDERNEHMATRILTLAGEYPRVAAVVGDAHVPGMRALLEERVDECRVVRVGELSKGVPSQVSWSVDASTD